MHKLKFNSFLDYDYYLSNKTELFSIDANKHIKRKMAIAKGVEPLTYSLEGSCSIH